MAAIDVMAALPNQVSSGHIWNTIIKIVCNVAFSDLALINMYKRSDLFCFKKGLILVTFCLTGTVHYVFCGKL